MHQTEAQETRLWSLNSVTNQYEQLLSSQYNPIGVQLLPDKSGFSFLDNGLIKVKNFLKRSPKTIEIYEPFTTLVQYNGAMQLPVFFMQSRVTAMVFIRSTLMGSWMLL